MAKPIFLVGLPFEAVKDVNELQKDFEKKMEDYYTLIYTHNKDDIEFKALYEKDFDKVKFEELKELVRSNAR